MDAIKQIVAKAGIVDLTYLDSPQGEMYLKIVVASLAVGAALALYLGTASASAPKKILATPELTLSTTEPHAMLPTITDWHRMKLVDKTALSHNTNLYVFEIPRPTGHIKGVHPDPVLGLPIGQHISVSAEIDGKNIVRSYTPTTLDGEDPGRFHLLVKAYEKGNISRYLSLLTVGQEVKVKGPKGKFKYTSDLADHFLMIAGGTGITPMYQIIKASLADESDDTQLRLIYANVNEDDILLRKELDDLQARSNGRFQVYYVLNNAPSNWTGGQGFITRASIEQHMPVGGVDARGKVLMCGPPPMMNAMKGHLEGIGYPKPNTISRLEDQVFLF
ncbi:NADH-cytochrome b5 reductase [Naganishia adeliensis]|uniref:NADH-cytochrome b5 reductase n=1 Tax=Naganishia adeliensis TaxID=92952 RepID=A0ACC2W2J3_9TREE|nr:NADH-cytochrome b5 reductase [Naganishia adeliensis]